MCVVNDLWNENINRKGKHDCNLLNVSPAASGWGADLSVLQADTSLGACIDTGAFKESIRGRLGIYTAWINFVFWQLSF